MLVYQTLFQTEESPKTKLVVSSIRKLVTDIRQDIEHKSPLTALFHSLFGTGEIISSATFDKSLQVPILPSDAVLSGASLAQVIGCQPWVFHKIQNISNLRTWKLGAVAAGTPNVVELAKKASAIENDMRLQLLVIEKDDDSPSDLHVLHITEVFAHAAEVYLHTTTSGAYPDVSNLRHAASQVVDTLQRLKCSRLLDSLAWPVCVAASMAAEEHDAFFDAIAQGARREDEYSKLSRALCVAQECQRLRKSNIPATAAEERRAYDWFDGMRSLGKESNLL
ncbi:hypothetical protein LTR81_024445 [Elasticomyces elasticus]